MNQITKAVIPLSGFTNVFLPATKAMPKEMMPIVDKPLIQYAVEEAADAGITDIIFITGRGKRIIEDHFDKAYELEEELIASGKDNVLVELRRQLPANMHFAAMHFRSEYGYGNALLCAQAFIGREAFAVVMPDQLIDAKPSALRQLIDTFDETGRSVIGVQDFRGRMAPKTISTAPPEENDTQDINAKTETETTTDFFRHVGRYIFNAAALDCLSRLRDGGQARIGLNDLLSVLKDVDDTMQCELQGCRYDCSSKVEYMKAMTAYGMKHPAIGSDLSAYVATLKSGKRVRAAARR